MIQGLSLFMSIFMVGLYPLFEGRHSLKHNIVSIFKDITGKEHPSQRRGSVAVFDGKDVSGTHTPAPVEKKLDVEHTTSIE